MVVHSRAVPRGVRGIAPWLDPKMLEFLMHLQWTVTALHVEEISREISAFSREISDSFRNI